MAFGDGLLSTLFALCWLMLMCGRSTQKSLKLFPLCRTRPQTPSIQIADVSFILRFGFLDSPNACFREQTVAVWFEKISLCLSSYLGEIAACLPVFSLP